MSITTTNLALAGGSASTPRFLDRIHIGLDNAYPTNGYAIGLSSLVGTDRTIVAVQAKGFVAASGVMDTRAWQYNHTSGRLEGLLSDGTGTVTPGTNVSTITVELSVESM